MSQTVIEKGSFVQFPVHLIYGRSDLTRDDKWTILSLMGSCWTDGAYRLSYREIAKIAGVPLSLLSSYTDKKGAHHEGIMDRIERVTGYVHANLGKELTASGTPKGNAQSYITIDYARIWQDNVAYCESKKQKTIQAQDYQPVSNTNRLVSNTNEPVPYTNEGVSNTNNPVSSVSSKVDTYITYTNLDYLDKKDTHVAAFADDASRSFPSSNNENDSHLPTSTDQFPTNDVEKLETNSQDAVSSTPSEASIIPSQIVENASVSVESGNSTPNTENASQGAKSQASGKVRIAATTKTSKPRTNTKKKALELVPVLPPARPLAETPWGVEKCLAWGDYVRKSTLPESTRKDSKSFKAKEAACKIIGRGITENSFLVIFVNWMKGIDLDLNPLANGELKSETWTNYSVDLWVVDEHYEDEARKYQKSKFTQNSIQAKKEDTAKPVVNTVTGVHTLNRELTPLEKRNRELVEKYGRKRA